MGDYWSCSTLTYTCMCLIANFHLVIHTRYWTCITHWAYWPSILSWFPVGILYCTQICIFLMTNTMYHVTFHLMATPYYWLSIPIICVVALLPDFTIEYVSRTYFPKPFQILQEYVNRREMKKKYRSQQGKWCCERGDCCCGCCRRCWCDSCP